MVGFAPLALEEAAHATMDVRDVHDALRERTEVVFESSRSQARATRSFGRGSDPVGRGGGDGTAIVKSCAGMDAGAWAYTCWIFRVTSPIMNMWLVWVWRFVQVPVSRDASLCAPYAQRCFMSHFA